jgi:regulator of nucleoside diphosphate kinase
MVQMVKKSKTSPFWESLRSRFFVREGETPRIFSEIDYYRLQGLLTRQHLKDFASFAVQLQQLRRMLGRGLLYPCKAVPGNLITMNSVVRLRSRRGTAFTVGLVYPRDADRLQRKVSVLSVLGLALIGKAEGEYVSENMAIEKILYQPESLGNYYL